MFSPQDSDKEKIFQFVQFKGRVRKEDIYQRFSPDIDPETISRRLRELTNDEGRLQHPEPNLFLQANDCKRFYEPVSGAPR